MENISPVDWLIMLIIAMILFLVFGNLAKRGLLNLGNDFKKGLKGVEDEIENTNRPIEVQSNKPALPTDNTLKSKRVAPSWMFPAGIIAIALGVLAFGLGAAKGGAEARPGDPPGQKLLLGLLDGGTNPLFFIGVPLGCYWLYRSAKGPARRALPTSEEANLKLTHCPDCGRHVSRLATSCPRCGRPMMPSNAPSP